MRTVSFICALLLLISILPIYSWFRWLPQWYNLLWQSIVCAGAFWLAWKDWRNKSLGVWNIALIMLGVLYNPVFPVHIEGSYISVSLKLFCILFLIVFGLKRNFPAAF